METLIPYVLTLPILPTRGSCCLSHPSLRPWPPHLRRRDPEKGQNARIPAPGVLPTLRGGGARSSRPTRSDSLALLSISPPRCLSYLLFSLKSAFFPKPRGAGLFCLTVFLCLCFPLGMCLCIFHGFSRYLSNFCAGFSVSLVVSASLTLDLSGLSVSTIESRSLGVSRSLGSLAVSQGLCCLPAFCAPTLLPSHGKLAHTSSFLTFLCPPLPGRFDPARVGPAGGQPHPPAAAATCEPERRWRSSSALHASFRCLRACCASRCTPPPGTASDC